MVPRMSSPLERLLLTNSAESYHFLPHSAHRTKAAVSAQPVVDCRSHLPQDARELLERSLQLGVAEP
jgi:hypothetical protein